jgi:hypothetical protein
MMRKISDVGTVPAATVALAATPAAAETKN